MNLVRPGRRTEDRSADRTVSRPVRCAESVALDVDDLVQRVPDRHQVGGIGQHLVDVLVRRRDLVEERRRVPVLDADPGRPVIWTVSVSRLTGLLGDVIPEFDRRARIEQINLGFEEAVDVIGQRLRREHCDVVIAGGANAAWLPGLLELPLVPIQANGFDLMEALARARRIAPRIGLVTHARDVPVFSNFQQSFGLDIEHRRFVTREDARDCIAALSANGIEGIVGTGMALEHAGNMGRAGRARSL